MSENYVVKSLSKIGFTISDINLSLEYYGQEKKVKEISPQLEETIERGDAEIISKPEAIEQRDRLFKLEEEKKQKEIELLIDQNKKLRQEIREKGTGSQVKETPLPKPKADKTDDFFLASKGTKWSNVTFTNINHTKIKISIGDCSEEFFFDVFLKRILPKYLTAILLEIIQNSGKIEKNGLKDEKDKKYLKLNISKLNKKLKEKFGIEEKPINFVRSSKYEEGTGSYYQALFRVAFEKNHHTKTCL